MRIAILCNDRAALPALDYLMQTKQVVAIGMSARVSETQAIIRNKCAKENLPFQLFSKKDFNTEILKWLQLHQPDVVLVKTFPYLVPADALAIPRNGFINFHYAPLPAWRGANPLFWMLRNGERTGAVTVHRMVNRYDEGPILLEQPLTIASNINFGILYTQLAHIGLQLTIKLVSNFEAIITHSKEQDHTKASWYDHPKAADLFINWQTMNAEEIIGLVKACNPWNKGAGTRWNGWTFGITYASLAGHFTMNAGAGTVLSLDPNAGFTISTRDNKAVVAEVVYCEEGFYPGYCLSAFGLKKNDKLT